MSRASMPDTSRRALLGLLAVAPMGALAQAGIPWRPEAVERYYERKDLRELLQELAASQGITAVVDPAIQATVVGRFLLPAELLFRQMVSTHGLIYFYQGNVLYVYPASAAVSEVVRLKRADPGSVLRTLRDMGIDDRRYPITLQARDRTLVVSGPQRLVDMVKQVAQAADEGEAGRVLTEVRVFRLRYAWANDYVFTQGGRGYTVPGVASVLRKLFNVDQPAEPDAGQIRGLVALNKEPVTRRLRNTELTLKVPPKMPQPDEWAAAATGGGRDSNAPVEAAGGRFPQFQADGRLNAVLVRDVAARMPMYDELIRSLDVRPVLVEIEATIIEIGSDDLAALGVDWRITSSRWDLRGGRNDLPTESPSGQRPPPGDPLVTGPFGGPALSDGAVITTVLNDAGRRLIARVNALAQDGRASVRATPKVLTLDNVEAVLERLSRFFVRVPGTYQSELFDVSAGMSMRVTPLVVDEGDVRRVKLSIKIEDGEVTAQRVDQIPVVLNNVIGTQAFVNDGESLLIAGYASEASSRTESGVPLLSKIPFIGALFRVRETRNGRVERLFMITPRIVAS
jgi:type III secretion protein C